MANTRWSVAAVMLLGCGGTSSALDSKVDKMSQDIAALKDEVGRLTKNDEALRTVTTQMFADVAGRLFVAGLTNEENKNVLRWWCAGGAVCVRDKAQCDETRRQFIARGNRPAECEARRIAYCGAVDTACFADLALCEKMADAKGRGLCFGAE